MNPVGDDGKNKWGSKKLIKGEYAFFINPGEYLENDIEDVYVL